MGWIDVAASLPLGLTAPDDRLEIRVLSIDGSAEAMVVRADGRRYPLGAVDVAAVTDVSGDGGPLGETFWRTRLAEVVAPFSGRADVLTPGIESFADIRDAFAARDAALARGEPDPSELYYPLTPLSTFERLLAARAPVTSLSMFRSGGRMFAYDADADTVIALMEISS